MTEIETLETVLADMRAKADALDRSHDRTGKAEMLREFAKRVEDTTEDYLKFLPEKEAVLWSGHAKVWLRQRYPHWERLGHAKKREHDRGERTYRRCILPRRADTAAARADAARTARAQNQ